MFLLQTSDKQLEDIVDGSEIWLLTLFQKRAPDSSCQLVCWPRFLFQGIASDRNDGEMSLLFSSEHGCSIHSKETVVRMR